MDLIGQVKGPRLEPEEASYANVLPNYQQAVADFMVGTSTGPRTKDGLKRLVESKTKHGRFTKTEREKAIQITEKRLKFLR